MTELQASKQLSGTTRLWRYLSLDKLVDLLSTSELFFTPQEPSSRNSFLTSLRRPRTR